jgi:hypothetical protein
MSDDIIHEDSGQSFHVTALEQLIGIGQTGTKCATIVPTSNAGQHALGWLSIETCGAARVYDDVSPEHVDTQAGGLLRKECEVMARAIWLVYTNCPADRERDFNDWYENVHLPDLLTVNGIAAAQRFRLPDDAPALVMPSGSTAVARYLALYELDTDDVAAVRAAIRALQLTQRGRGFDGLEVVASMDGTALGGRRTSAPVEQAGSVG